MTTPYFIGIVGGTCSGKSQLARTVAQNLDKRCEILPLDSYYVVDPNRKDHDHPTAIDFTLLNRDLESLSAGNAISIPLFGSHVEVAPTKSKLISPTDVIIVEGLHVFWDKDVLSKMSLRVFLDIDADIRLARRIIRDVVEYSLNVEDVCQYYLTTVRLAHNHFIEPMREYADLIITSLTTDDQVEVIERYLKKQAILQSS